MNITIDIPDELNKQLLSINNVNAFIVDALKTALALQPSLSLEDNLISDKQALLIHEQLMNQYAETFEKLAQ